MNDNFPLNVYFDVYKEMPQKSNLMRYFMRLKSKNTFYKSYIWLLRDFTEIFFHLSSTIQTSNNMPVILFYLYLHITSTKEPTFI